jgi:uncharacterized tellurite resistance protein B-like protein
MTHPAESLSIEDRVAYVRAVAALIAVDGKVDDQEISAIHALAEEVHVDRAALDVDAFAREPDVALVEAALSRVAELELGHALLTDTITMACADGTIAPDESRVIDHYAHRLHVPIAQAGLLARYVAATHAAPDGHPLDRDLISGIAAAEKLQSPSRIRAFMARLRNR